MKTRRALALLAPTACLLLAGCRGERPAPEASTATRPAAGQPTETSMDSIVDHRGAAIGVGRVEALAADPALAHVTALDLSENPIGDAGAVALARSPHAGVR